MPTNKPSKDEIKYLNKEDKTKLMLEIENQYNEKIEDLLFRLYWEKKRGTPQIGIALEVNSDTILTWMKKFRIPRRSHIECQRIKKITDIENKFEEKIGRLLTRLYWDEGKSTTDIANMIGNIDSGTIRNIMIRREIPIRDRTEGIKKAYQEEELREKIRQIMIKEWEDNEKRRQQQSKIMREKWQDPQYRTQCLKKHQESVQSKEYKQKMSRITTQLWQDDEYREKVLQGIRETCQSEEFRQKMSKQMKCLWQDPKFREQQLKRMQEVMQSKEYKQKMREITTQLWQNGKYREKVLATRQSEDFRKDCSKRARRLWQDPEYVEKTLSAMGESPNNLETLVDSITPDNLRFVGDGSWWRWLPSLKQHKNPDFKITGEDKVIEIYGSHPWHRDDDPQELIDAFAEVGIECIVIWDYEVYDKLEDTLDKIANFIRQKDWQLSLL